MEYDKANIRKVLHVREDKTEEEGYAIYIFKDGVVKQDIFVKDVILNY